MRININDLDVLLTNFMINHTEKPTPVEVSNMPITFLAGCNKYTTVTNISINPSIDEVIVEIE